MKNLLILFTLACLGACQGKPDSSPTIPAIILDTDIAGDYDDVGAMALMHCLADSGKVNILAVQSCNSFHTTVPTISLINKYFGREEIPVGVTKRELPNKDCPQKWAESILSKYPTDIAANETAPDAVTLYRKILSSQPDNSVTIISVGFFTNLADLLKSKPDSYSDLDGSALVKKKVAKLVSMATGLDSTQTSGREYNVFIDAPSAALVLNQWPTEIILSGFEIGEKILTGIPLINNQSIVGSPVKDSYSIALAKDNNTEGRMSWDQTAVLVGIKGIEPYFNFKEVNFEIREDGTNVMVPGKRFKYLTFKKSPTELSKIIEGYMMHQPVANTK